MPKKKEKIVESDTLHETLASVVDKAVIVADAVSSFLTKTKDAFGELVDDLNKGKQNNK